MIISDQSVFLSLSVGVILGILLVINKIIVAGNRKKRLIIFLADFTFTAIAVVLTFIAAIPIYKGRVRFFQVALELIGLLAFYYSLGESFIKIIMLFSALFDRILRYFRKKSKNILKYCHKPKKTLKTPKKTY